MHKYLLILILTFSGFNGFSQELNCNVIIDAERVQTQEKNFLNTMQNAINEFMNTRRWTERDFKPEERIACNVLIQIIDMPTLGNFKANIIVQSSRPVYNTDYESLMLNYVDKSFNFVYQEGQQLLYTENIFTSNLAAVLAYYAHIIIGLDFDSFSPLGGQPYFEEAWQITNNIPSPYADDDGWKQSANTTNRYWLIENLINKQLEPVRSGIYTYHRKGMDIMAEDQEETRNTILEVLKDFQRVRATQPVSILMDTFFDSKGDEIVNIFSEGNFTTKQQAYSMLSRLDPTNSDTYRQILRR